MSAICQALSDIKYEVSTAEELHGVPTKNPRQLKAFALSTQKPVC